MSQNSHKGIYSVLGRSQQIATSKEIIQELIENLINRHLENLQKLKPLNFRLLGLFKCLLKLLELTVVKGSESSRFFPISVKKTQKNLILKRLMEPSPTPLSGLGGVQTHAVGLEEVYSPIESKFSPKRGNLSQELQIIKVAEGELKSISNSSSPSQSPRSAPQSPSQHHQSGIHKFINSLSKKSTKRIIVEIYNLVMVGAISEAGYIEGAKQLRSSLSYFDRETEMEATTADRLEEFIFAIYQVEKHRSGIDYLALNSLEESEMLGFGSFGSKGLKSGLKLFEDSAEYGTSRRGYLAPGEVSGGDEVRYDGNGSFFEQLERGIENLEFDQKFEIFTVHEESDESGGRTSFENSSQNTQKRSREAIMAKTSSNPCDENRSVHSFLRGRAGSLNRPLSGRTREGGKPEALSLSFDKETIYRKYDSLVAVFSNRTTRKAAKGKSGGSVGGVRGSIEHKTHKKLERKKFEIIEKNGEKVSHVGNVEKIGDAGAIFETFEQLNRFQEVNQPPKTPPKLGLNIPQKELEIESRSTWDKTKDNRNRSNGHQTDPTGHQNPKNQAQKRAHNFFDESRQEQYAAYLAFKSRFSSPGDDSPVLDPHSKTIDQKAFFRSNESPEHLNGPIYDAQSQNETRNHHNEHKKQVFFEKLQKTKKERLQQKMRRLIEEGALLSQSNSNLIPETSQEGQKGALNKSDIEFILGVKNTKLSSRSEVIQHRLDIIECKIDLLISQMRLKPKNTQTHYSAKDPEMAKNEHFRGHLRAQSFSKPDKSMSKLKKQLRATFNVKEFSSESYTPQKDWGTQNAHNGHNVAQSIDSSISAGLGSFIAMDSYSEKLKTPNTSSHMEESFINLSMGEDSFLRSSDRKNRGCGPAEGIFLKKSDLRDLEPGEATFGTFDAGGGVVGARGGREGVEEGAGGSKGSRRLEREGDLEGMLEGFNSLRMRKRAAGLVLGRGEEAWVSPDQPENKKNGDTKNAKFRADFEEKTTANERRGAGGGQRGPRKKLGLKIRIENSSGKSNRKIEKSQKNGNQHQKTRSLVIKAPIQPFRVLGMAPYSPKNILNQQKKFQFPGRLQSPKTALKPFERKSGDRKSKNLTPDGLNSRLKANLFKAKKFTRRRLKSHDGRLHHSLNLSSRMNLNRSGHGVAKKSKKIDFGRRMALKDSSIKNLLRGLNESYYVQERPSEKAVNDQSPKNLQNEKKSKTEILQKSTKCERRVGNIEHQEHQEVCPSNPYLSKKVKNGYIGKNDDFDDFQNLNTSTFGKGYPELFKRGLKSLSPKIVLQKAPKNSKKTSKLSSEKFTQNPQKPKKRPIPGTAGATLRTTAPESTKKSFRRQIKKYSKRVISKTQKQTPKKKKPRTAQSPRRLIHKTQTYKFRTQKKLSAKKSKISQKSNNFKNLAAREDKKNPSQPLLAAPHIKSQQNSEKQKKRKIGFWKKRRGTPIDERPLVSFKRLRKRLRKTLKEGSTKNLGLGSNSPFRFGKRRRRVEPLTQSVNHSQGGGNGANLTFSPKQWKTMSGFRSGRGVKKSDVLKDREEIGDGFERVAEPRDGINGVFHSPQLAGGHKRRKIFVGDGGEDLGVEGAGGRREGRKGSQMDVLSLKASIMTSYRQLMKNLNKESF